MSIIVIIHHHHHQENGRRKSMQDSFQACLLDGFWCCRLYILALSLWGVVCLFLFLGEETEKRCSLAEKRCSLAGMISSGLSVFLTF